MKVSKTLDDILALERKLWTEGNKSSTYKQILADNSISVIEPMGFVEKAVAVEAGAQGMAYQDVEFKDVVIREMTPDCVILAYHGKAGGEKPYQGSIASTYVKRDNRWQLALTSHQPWQPKE